jgi:hypothetical protein
VSLAVPATLKRSARPIAKDLSEKCKQPVIVENKTGAGGTIGADLVAKSAPDGYTMLLADSSVVMTFPSLYPTLPYAAKDLLPVANIATFGLILIAPANSKFNTLAEFVAADLTLGMLSEPPTEPVPSATLPSPPTCSTRPCANLVLPLQSRGAGALEARQTVACRRRHRFDPAVVPASELAPSRAEITKLQRVLGTKTLENDILKEAVEYTAEKSGLRAHRCQPGTTGEDRVSSVGIGVLTHSGLLQNIPWANCDGVCTALLQLLRRLPSPSMSPIKRTLSTVQSSLLLMRVLDWFYGNDRPRRLARCRDNVSRRHQSPQGRSEGRCRDPYF